MKKTKGISLIVLIITIVVIIILGTAIVVNLAKTDIIGNANEATVKQDFKTFQEELNLYAANEYAQTSGKFDLSTFNADKNTTPSVYDVIKKLKKSKYDGYVSIVNGSIFLSDEMDEEIRQWASEVIDLNNSARTITASDILSNPSEYYGKEVEYKIDNPNVVASNAIMLAEQYDNTTWKIFYADHKNIYLIASETLKVSGKQYTKMFNNSTEALNYLNNKSNWNNFVNNYAEYALGGPTISMFANSWNAKYPDKAITLSGDDTNGWKINGDYEIDLKVQDSLYWKDGQWYLLNSKAAGTNVYPVQVDAQYLMSNSMVYNEQYGGENQYYNSIGYRPIICLKEGIELESFGDKLKLKDLNEKVLGATLVQNDAKKYYGKTVNYKTGNSELDSKIGWQIFHSDGQNIYLIAKNYVYENIPNTSNGSIIVEEENITPYVKNFDNIFSEYPSGLGNISSTNPARKWLKKYLESYSNSNLDNSKVTAYMIDTNLWDALYKGENAKYAIGGPTVEMFVESYNNTHDSSSQVSKIYTAVDEYGYYVDVNENPTVTYVSYMDNTGEYNNLYVLPESYFDGYYFASPSSKRPDDDTLYMHCCHQNPQYLGEIAVVSVAKPPYMINFRPVICLDGNISLQEKKDGTYDIIK